MPPVLVHRFTIAEPLTWSEVTVELAPGQWRVGGPNGPVASAWQLQTALGALIAVEVGGCCSAWVDGPTAYPCGFTLSGFDLLGLDVDREPASASPAATSMPELTKTDAFACAQQDTKARDGPMRQGAMRFVSVRPWLHNAGDHTRALGTALRFQFRGIVNHLHASKIDRASGVVIFACLAARPRELNGHRAGDSFALTARVSSLCNCPDADSSALTSMKDWALHAEGFE